ncbi:heterogeneous nuclear ribonucleoprotein A1-like [Chironomus tepperi]|uniref:heterogeneous nuclear ribonucleoprotein A1-like n=1 Tax=Chironomus tepperi TaxID=113505 RepID=UPI00391F78AD
MGRDRNFGRNRNQQSNFGTMMSSGSGNNSMFNDFEPRNNRGGRPNNRATPLLNLRPGSSRMDDDEDFTADTYGPAKSYGSGGSLGMGNKTPEQVAFDNEFEKWEQSFADWKLNNRNHPDPDQYRVYEQKFLDVRSKLLKKRREIYGEGGRAGSGKNPFDNQLNAADAMANSILSKFGAAAGNAGRRNNNNSQGGGRQGGNNGGNNGGNGNRGNGGGNNDILNNELILTALKVISGGMGGNMGGNMGGPMNNMGGPMRGGGPMCGPMFNRGGYGGGYGGNYNDGPYGSGYGRGYGRGYDGGYGRNDGRNGRRGGDNRMGPRNGNPGRNDPIKSDKKKKKKKPAGEKKPLKEGEIDSRIPFLDRIPTMYEEARNAECPKLLSGAANRRLKILKELKDADKLSDKEKLFMEYAEYVFKKRDEYYKLHPKEDKAAKTEDVAMDDKAEAKTDDAKAGDATTTAEAAKAEDVEMNEDELLKD